MIEISAGHAGPWPWVPERTRRELAAYVKIASKQQFRNLETRCEPWTVDDITTHLAVTFQRFADMLLQARAGDPAPPANKKMLNEAVKHIHFSPFHSGWREIEEKYLEPKLDLIFNGKKTAAEVAKELAPLIDAALQSHDN